MKGSNILIGIVFSLYTAGCVPGTPAVRESEKLHPDNAAIHIQAESEKLGGAQKELTDSLEKVLPRKIDVEPLRPAYDPLEDHIVSFSMVEEDFQMVLYSLSKAVGMNLIIDPEITKEERLLTLNFENVSASTVLNEILNNYDLYYQIEENIIRVKPYKEQIFKLNFLDTEITTSFDVGGDVLGAGGLEAASGLSGNFRLSGTGAKKGNSYDALEDMVKKVVSSNGKYSLNRLSGSLYVKDTPAVIRSISKLINYYKDMLSRQILIEARIVEVHLSDEYKYGIDWSVLRGSSIVTKKLSLNSAAWSLMEGLVLGGVYRDWSINATIDALETFGDAKVISNPSIRAKHGKPAIISVGTSFTYKKSVDVTSSTTATTDEQTTEVEVATVFDGLILGVIPFIEEDGRITLLINPIKSDVDQESLKPESAGGGQSISLPQVSVREISTTIALETGDIIILGGLIDKRKNSVTEGVPFLSNIPILGYLFKNDLNRGEFRELVIILSVSII